MDDRSVAFVLEGGHVPEQYRNCEIVPMALFQYYPMLYILGRSENPWLCAAPLGILVFLLPVSLLWKLGVRHYRSTGS